MQNPPKKKFSPLALIFVLAWMLFMAKGILYSVITPLWEGIDEPFHFAYIQSLAATHSLPVWGETFVERDIAESTAYVPLPPLMPRLAKGASKMSYRDYWRLQGPERQELKEELHSLRAGVETNAPSSSRLYQAQHPPLYYILCLPLYEYLNSADLVEKVYALRIFSVFLASISLVAAAFLARGRGLFGATFLVLVALWPGLYADIARIGNDSLGASIFSFLMLAMFLYAEQRTVPRAAFMGILLGFGLLTKAYFLTALPAVGLFMIILAIEKKELKRAVIAGSVVFICIITIAGWWYLRNYMLYGTFSGLQESIYFPSVGLPEKLRAAFSMPWTLFVKHIFVTFSWVSGWSFLHLPKAGYLIFAVFLAVAGAGIIRGLISRSSESAIFSRKDYALTVSIALLMFFALGIAYHEMNVMATVKVMGGPGGWYLYALVVPISFVVSFGIASFGRQTARLLFAIFSAALFLTEAYGFIAVLFPYYEGIAVPAANGWGVEKIQGVEIPAGEAIARLLANKPAVFSPALLVVAAVVYVLLYCASMAVWFFLGRTDTPSAETNPHEDAPAAVWPVAKD